MAPPRTPSDDGSDGGDAGTPSDTEDAASGSVVPEGVDLGTSALPQDVLVGTDVVPLSSLITHPQGVASGSYRSEQGGALATVKIELSSSGAATLTRKFQEPGETSHTKAYKRLQPSADGFRLTGQEVEVIGVREGVVVLEQASEVESLPKSLWILYEPSRASRKKESR